MGGGGATREGFRERVEASASSLGGTGLGLLASFLLPPLTTARAGKTRNEMGSAAARSTATASLWVLHSSRTAVSRAHDTPTAIDLQQLVSSL